MYKKLILSVLLIALSSWFAYSQSGEEIFQDFQFNFAPPGARASAMGKAFIALADDVTAAETNPAGLTILMKPELSFEFKNSDITIKRFAAADSLITQVPSNFGGNVNSASFLSFFYPFKNVHVAFFRHQFLNLTDKFNFEARPIPGTDRSYYPVTASMDFKGSNYGVALAAKAGNLSLGVSFKISTLKAKSSTFREYFDQTWWLGNETNIDDSDTDFSVTAGIIWKPTQKFSLGAVYTRSPKFKIEEDFGYYDLNNNYTSFGWGEDNRQRFPTDVFINVPDKFGFGFAVRPKESLTLLMDMVHVRYSQQAENFKILFTGKEFLMPEDYVIKNATELHLGGEYVMFVGKNPFAIRAGVFTEPDHKIKFVNPNIPDPAAQLQSTIEESFWNLGNRDTKLGFSVGAGLVIKERLQLDFAYAMTDLVKELSVSTVVRF